MNQWPVYSYIKRCVLETGKFPTAQEIKKSVPNATFSEIREGIIEARIQYEREWKRHAPETIVRRQRA